MNYRLWKIEYDEDDAQIIRQIDVLYQNKTKLIEELKKELKEGDDIAILRTI